MEQSSVLGPVSWACVADKSAAASCPQSRSKLSCGQLWKTGLPRLKPLAKRLHEGVDKAVEISVPLPHVFDLSNRVDHSRVVLAAKTASDLGKRRAGQVLTEIHGDLSRHRDRFRVVSRFELAVFELVVIGDELLNTFNRARSWP